MRVCLGGKLSIYFSKFRKCFGIFGVFIQQIVVLNIGFGFCVFRSIWEHGLKQFFEHFFEFVQTNPRSVINFRTDHFVRDVLGLLVLNCTQCNRSVPKGGRGCGEWGWGAP